MWFAPERANAASRSWRETTRAQQLAEDRDGFGLVLDRRTRRLFPFVEHVADVGYQGPQVAQTAASTGRWVVEIGSVTNAA